MKLTYIRLYMDYNSNTGGLSEQEKKDVKDAFETAAAPLKEKISTLEKEAKENQEAVDNLLTRMKGVNGALNIGKKSFNEAFAIEVKSNFEQLQNITKRNGVTLNLKTVGDMATSTNLTGDGQTSYSQQQGLVPSPTYNFRDFIPATISATGQYVHYRETGGEGGAAVQTEGSAKAQIDFDFTEVKTVQTTIAGYVRFTKQLMKNLPWLQTTLPRLLMRKYFEVENARFSGIFAANANGFGTSFETDNAKQIIDILAGRGDSNFKTSFMLCRYTELGKILKLLYANGYYQGAGSVVGQPDGSVRIMNTPIVPVSWVPSNDKIMFIDNDYIERVEMDSLKVEFFEQDGNNVTENKITARIECTTELNLLRTDAHSYIDTGDSASS